MSEQTEGRGTSTALKEFIFLLRPPRPGLYLLYPCPRQHILAFRRLFLSSESAQY